MGDKLYIVIPAYNEEENILQVVEDWYPVVENFGNESRLVVVDDESKDSTYTILQKSAETRDKLIVLTKKNGGHGTAVLYGYHYALESGADYIFQTDSDRQTKADEFKEFWNNRMEYDLVIGNRNHRKDGISRVFVTKTLKCVLHMVFGVWITDANTPFRLMNREKLEKVLQVMPEEYNLPNVIIPVAYTIWGEKVKYIPITFRERQGGVNSINLKKIVKIGIQAINDFRCIRKNIDRAKEV